MQFNSMPSVVLNSFSWFWRTLVLMLISNQEISSPPRNSSTSSDFFSLLTGAQGWCVTTSLWPPTLTLWEGTSSDHYISTLAMRRGCVQVHVHPVRLVVHPLWLAAATRAGVACGWSPLATSPHLPPTRLVTSVGGCRSPLSAANVAGGVCGCSPTAGWHSPPPPPTSPLLPTPPRLPAHHRHHRQQHLWAVAMPPSLRGHVSFMHQQ